MAGPLLWPKEPHVRLPILRTATVWWARCCRGVLTANLGLNMRRICAFTALTLVWSLSLVLAGHLWNRYSDETEALGFSGIYERALAAQAGFAGDPQAYRAATTGSGFVQQASALEE